MMSARSIVTTGENGEPPPGTGYTRKQIESLIQAQPTAIQYLTHERILCDLTLTNLDETMILLKSQVEEWRKRKALCIYGIEVCQDLRYSIDQYRDQVIAQPKAQFEEIHWQD